MRIKCITPPSQFTAMVASHQPLGASLWYTDIGATDHITSDINILTLRFDYHGSKKISVGMVFNIRRRVFTLYNKMELRTENIVIL